MDSVSIAYVLEHFEIATPSREGGIVLVCTDSKLRSLLPDDFMYASVQEAVAALRDDSCKRLTSRGAMTKIVCRTVLNWQEAGPASITLSSIPLVSLFDPDVKLKWLRSVKEEAKAAAATMGSDRRLEALTIYWLAIAGALLSHDAMISSHPPGKVREALVNLVRSRKLPTDIARHLTEACEVLRPTD